MMAIMGIPTHPRCSCFILWSLSLPSSGMRVYMCAVLGGVTARTIQQPCQFFTDIAVASSVVVSNLTSWLWAVDKVIH